LKNTQEGCGRSEQNPCGKRVLVAKGEAEEGSLLAGKEKEGRNRNEQN